MEPLESRTLYSADPFSAGIFSVGIVEEAPSSSIEAFSDPDQSTLGLASPNTNSNSTESQVEIIFIDETTPDYELLVKDLLANGSPDRTFEIITISAEQDGIQLISNILAQHSGVSAVHLISHGSDGNVNIGKSVLNQSTFSTHENLISNWGHAFTETGDLLIYGCNFSATEAGKMLGANIAALAEVDIASSDNRTGGGNVGGDWVLEQVVGTVEATVPFSDQLQDSYQRSLASSISVSTAADIVDAPSTASFDDLTNAPGADGKISLREAIIAANTQAGTDTINLSADTYSITITGGFNNPQESGDHDITSNIIIQGVNSTQTIIEATGLTERVLEVHAGGELTLLDVTVTGGFDREGAGIRNDGILHAEDVLLANNSSQSRAGGGIYNTGSTTIVNSSLESNSGNLGGAIRNATTGTLLIENTYIDGSNSSGNNGAGLYNEGVATLRQAEISNSVAISGAGIYQAAGTLTIEKSAIKDNAATNGNGGGIHIFDGDVTGMDSTFSGNSANSGAGIFLRSGTTLDLLNSTFSDNRAAFNGGGIHNDGGTTTVSFTTFAFNSARTGGAVYDESGTLAVDNSIFSNSLGNMFNGVDIHAVSVSNGYNIIESANVGGSNIHPTDLVGVDPLLSPLAQNGGTTQTHALTTGSPALDNGDSTASAVDDQRGVPRDAAPDIGSFEGISGGTPINTPPVITPSLTTNIYTENANLVIDGSMTITDSDSTDFQGGIFNVASTGFNETVDQISIASVGTGPGEILIVNNTVLFQGIIVGTAAGGSGSNPLTVSLNAQADIAAVNALARSITFTTLSEDPSTNNRTLSYSIDDGDGETSNIVDIDITVTEVNDAPVISYQTDFVIINEIHYDNLSFDANETIEIAGNAGTNLNGWSLELYNGSNDTGWLYDTIPLSGIIPDEGNGFGALDFPVLGLQNGPRDGIALIDDSGNVIEFISYEGTVTATQGTAAGMTSSDIGVSEGPGGSDVESLQRTNLSPASTWDWPSPSSFGAINLTQSATDPFIQTVAEDSSLIFSAASSNAIQISDPETSSNLNITITPVSGLVALPSNPGLQLPVLQFVGSPALINTAIDGLIYTPDPNFNGTDTLTVVIEDQDPVNSLTDTLDIDIVVTPVNDAPSGTDKILTINEDSPVTIIPTDFGFSDVIENNLFAAVTITTLPANGTLELAGVAVTAGQLISANDINNGGLVFTPTTDDNGTAYADFGFQVHDNGGTLNGGIDKDPTTNKITFDVVSVNDAPEGKDTTLTAVEDSPLTLSAANFGFTDSIDGDSFESVVISPPANGLLTLAGAPVGINQTISVNDINNGDLIFTPAPDTSGLSYATLGFRVIDDGGTANGGTDQDQSVNTITIDATEINDPPVIEFPSNAPIVLINEIHYTNFGIDTNERVEIAATAGTDLTGWSLELYNQGDIYDTIQISGLVPDEFNGFGAISFPVAPLQNGPNDAIALIDDTGNVVDFICYEGAQMAISGSAIGMTSVNIGVAENGQNTDALDSLQRDTITPNSSWSVSSPNSFGSLNPPQLTVIDLTQSIDEDTSLTFNSTNKNLIQIDDPDTSNNLKLTITSNFGAVALPANPGLTFATLEIVGTLADINSQIDGLIYTPDSNFNGTDTLTVLIEDQDPVNSLSNTLDIDIVVTPINDAPEGTNNTLTVLEDSTLTFAASNFGFSDTIENDNFAAVTITTLPANGLLELNSTILGLPISFPVIAGQTINTADINNGALVFTPDSDENGVAYTSFDFQVHDDGGTANGGVDQDQTPNSITIDVTSVNDTPLGTDNTLNTNEDTPLIINAADFGFSDPVDGNNFAAVTVTTLPANGSLELNGTPVTDGQLISITNISNNELLFVPDPDSNGTTYTDFTFQVHDDGGTANGGVDQDTMPDTITINVISVNDAPSGTDNTLNTNEDTPLIINAADFGFSDPVEGHNFAAVTVTTLPANGSLQLKGTPVTTGQLISITNISNNELRFIPAPDSFGTANALVTFQVHDDGGTANNGVDQDTTPKTITIDVNSVSDEPDGTDNTLTINEDSPYSLDRADFGFSDPADNDNFTGITITNLPLTGSLELAGAPVTLTQTISVSDIDLGNLVYVPVPNSQGTSDRFDFRVIDSGNTLNGGINQDLLPNGITLDINNANDAPSGTDNILNTNEDTPLIINAADFGFSDPVDSDNFAAVTITALPANGLLELNGIAVIAGQIISITNINNGELVFTSANDGNGTAYTDFDFQVHDNGGITNGGIDQDQTPNTLTIDVTSVNDAPLGTDNTLTTSENTPITIQPIDFGFSDPVDNDNFAAVTVPTLPANGSLELNGIPVTTGQLISITDISNGELIFTPVNGGNGNAYANFDFQVHDDGGIANSGVDQDQTPYTITIDVAGVNNAPKGTDNILTLDEDSPLIIESADFGFSDPLDGDNLAAITISTLPANGSLELNGNTITAGQIISITNINNSELVFTPAANDNGAAYTEFAFRVHDDGGTLNGGQDTSQSVNTVEFNVSQVNDEPQATDATYTLLEDQSRTLTLADLGYFDPADNHPFNGATISSAPVNGQLLSAGTLLNTGDFISASALNNGDIEFVPAANTSGTAYDSFSFQVQDTGGVANNGIDTNQTPATITFNVIPVSDVPSGLDGVINVHEDSNYIFELSDFGFSDALDINPDQFNAVEITQLPITGELTINSVVVAPNQTVSAADIMTGNLIYVPSQNTYGQAFDNFLFKVIDTGNTLSGGQNQDQTDNQILIDINSVSDAPIGTDSITTINEDTPYTLQASDFGFSDLNDGDYFAAITVVDMPAHGNLTLSGSPITANQVVSITDVSNGNLVFTPTPNENGSGYADFTFLVHDTGSTANGGLTISQSQNTALFNVVPVNDAPTGQDSSAQVTDNSAYTLSAADFPFSDQENHGLQGIRIDSLPATGTLTLSNQPLAAGTIVTLIELSSGALEYQPVNNVVSQDVIEFSVIDNGSNTNGGDNIQNTPAQLTITTLTVNDPPLAADNTLLINEDSNYTLNTTDFGFSDPVEQHSLTEVIITAVNGNGTLVLNGTPISTTASASIAQLNAGQLVYLPSSDAAGSNYVSIEFSVRDNGGTDNGGQDTSLAHTLNIDVLEVNDAPTAQIAVFDINESSAHVFQTGDFGFSDSDGDALQNIIFTQLPFGGTLTVDGTDVLPGQAISVADISGSKLIYLTAPGQWGQSYDSLQFRVQDNGGTLNGGEDTATQAETLTFNVIEVNTPPSGTDIAIDIDEDSSHTLGRSDFGFSDTDDNHAFLSILVSSLNVDGQLNLGNSQVSIGDSISVSDIDAGLLTYTPDTTLESNSGTHQIGFQVRDSGNPVNGPTLDQTENLINYNLTLINDPPTLINEGATFAEGSDNTISTTVLAAIDPDDPAQDLFFTLQSIPENGQLRVNDTILNVGDFFTMQQLTNSEIRYIPDGSETSSDFFNFSLADGGEDGVVPVTARFNIDVTEVVDPIPALRDNGLTLNTGDTFDTALGDVLNSGETSLLDASLLGSSLFEIEIIDQPDHGTVTINQDGTFLYKHDGSNSGTDFFIYRVTNDGGATATATVNIISEPQINSAIAAPLEIVTPFVTVPATTANTQQEQVSTLEVQQLTQVTDTLESTSETTASSDSEAVDADQQTDQSTLLSSEESLFSVSALPSTSSFANQPGALSNVTYTDYDFELDASIIERDLLRSLDVRQHNETNSIVLFENYKNTTVSVSSVDIRLDLPTSLSEAANNKGFLRGISRAQESLESADCKERRRIEAGSEVAIGVSISTTAGILAWLLRGGALFGSMMTATPLWSSIDPLRVTDAKNRDDEEEKSEVEDLFR